MKIIGVGLSILAIFIPIIIPRLVNSISKSTNIYMHFMIKKNLEIKHLSIYDGLSLLQCTSAGIGLVFGRIVLVNHKIGVVNCIFWTYLLSIIYFFIYLLFD